MQRLSRLAQASFAVSLCLAAPLLAQTPSQPTPPVSLPANLPVLSAAEQARLDPLLMEIDIPRLRALYAAHKLTVTQVTRWYITRIARYDGIYRDVQTVDATGALAIAKHEDANHSTPHGPLWGVPMVIKANTAIQGLPDTDGWAGFAIPGHEFIAPRDATVVARLRAAGVVILGITNMPDFAASDTNRSTAFGRTGNAYDVRFSPGGSSGGTVTAVTSNEAVLGTGTDTANSIRMPSGTSSVVGLLPTRGLTSIAGIAPLDWLRDNTGPISRNVTDVAIALGVMAGEDPLDFRTEGSAQKAQPGPYTQYLKKDALKGKRFGVPAFILATATSDYRGRSNGMQPETRAMLMQTLDQLRAAGATIVIDDNLLPASFLELIRKVDTQPYRKDGADQWLAAFGPAEYHTGAEYEKATGQPMPPVFTGAPRRPSPDTPPQTVLKTDPNADKNFFGPQREALAAYNDTLTKFHLDGLVYPSAQMPPPDETMPQNGQLSGGPHSATGWVNSIGIPAIVVPAGYYPNGLPFGLEIDTRQWHDGDLLGYAYAYEQATHLRKPPVLVEKGLLPIPQ
ncbi:amidase [Granulicella sp. 5B5]|uniref:amidase n=1 Tax=Granulicella sp. 5B5 TaxID=1617967 RepID=UPI0015F75957|nr:amidase [Granulicella sp. 5B5]QMV18666.1 amidase [Granulicella sp. 5B5]